MTGLILDLLFFFFLSNLFLFVFMKLKELGLNTWKKKSLGSSVGEKQWIWAQNNTFETAEIMGLNHWSIIDIFILLHVSASLEWRETECVAKKNEKSQERQKNRSCIIKQQLLHLWIFGL